MAMTRRQTDSERRRITILGSTGSVGCSTLDLIERNRGAYAVEALTAFRNASGLAEQARRIRPALAVIGDHGEYGNLRRALEGKGIEVDAVAALEVENLVNRIVLGIDRQQSGPVFGDLRHNQGAGADETFFVR